MAADDERVWMVPVTVMIIAASQDDAFAAIAAALHEDANVQTVGGGTDSIYENVEGTEELRRCR